MKTNKIFIKTYQLIRNLGMPYPKERRILLQQKAERPTPLCCLQQNIKEASLQIVHQFETSGSQTTGTPLPCCCLSANCRGLSWHENHPNQ